MVSYQSRARDLITSSVCRSVFHNTLIFFFWRLQVIFASPFLPKCLITLFHYYPSSLGLDCGSRVSGLDFFFHHLHIFLTIRKPDRFPSFNPFSNTLSRFFIHISFLFILVFCAMSRCVFFPSFSYSVCLSLK